MKVKANQNFWYATDGIGYKTEHVKEGETVDIPETPWLLGAIDCGLCVPVDEKKSAGQAPENKKVDSAPAKKKAPAKKTTKKKD
jgi:hypothetical protein